MSWICSSRVQCKTERLQQDQPPTPVLLNTGTASLNIFTIFFLFSFLTKYVCIQDWCRGQVRIFSRITLLDLIIPASGGGNQSCSVMASDHHSSVLCGYIGTLNISYLTWYTATKPHSCYHTPVVKITLVTVSPSQGTVAVVKYSSKTLSVEGGVSNVI